MMKKITIIAAMAKNRVIGKNNSLPWSLPADLEHFKHLTLGKPVIMGRKTYESLGQALPGRKNIVITQHKDYPAPNCELFHDLSKAIEKTKAKEIMIIGGGHIYHQALPLANAMYLTFINADIPGDTFFPEIDMEEWDEMSREVHEADKDNPYPYSFVTLKRRRLSSESAVKS